MVSILLGLLLSGLSAATAAGAAACKRERAPFCQLPYPVHASLSVALLDASARSRYDALATQARDDSCRRALRYYLCYETFPGCVADRAGEAVRSCRELCELVVSCGFGVAHARECDGRAAAWPAEEEGDGSAAAAPATPAPRCLYPEDSHFSPHAGAGFPDPLRFDRTLRAASALSLAALAQGRWPHMPALPQLLRLRGTSAFGDADAEATWADGALLDFALQRFARGRRLLELGVGAGFGCLRLALLARTRLGARQRRVRCLDVVDRRQAAARRGWPGNARFELVPGRAARRSSDLGAMLRRALQPERAATAAAGVPVDAAEAQTLGALLVARCVGSLEQSHVREMAVLASLAALAALGAGGADLGGGGASSLSSSLSSAPPPAEPLLVLCADTEQVHRSIAVEVAAGRVVELHADFRQELGSRMRVLRRPGGTPAPPASSAATMCGAVAPPRIGVAPAYKQYWGWPEAALRGMPAQCRGRCELLADSSAAELLLFPAHALDPAATLEQQVPAGQRALLVCQEPWCHNWANVSHPRVASVAGYHRGMDFWLPSRCPELLDLDRRGPPPPARARHRAKVAAFVSNCNTPVRQAVLKALMDLVPVDSYGQCLHNADFNTTVEHGFFGARTYYQKHEAATGVWCEPTTRARLRLLPPAAKSPAADETALPPPPRPRARTAPLLLLRCRL